MVTVDVVVISRTADPLRAEVACGLSSQAGVEIVVHRVVGEARSTDTCRLETIVRARNVGIAQGTSPWLMFVDDDVVLASDCVHTLVRELSRRPAFGALAADYLDERCPGEIASHVAMGATLFRREALAGQPFRWCDGRCECQCCCDDLRRRRWGIDYCATARATHLRPAKHHCHATPANEADRGAASTEQQECASSPSGRTPSVCLIACYFGPLPPWIDYYLLSCSYCPTIDFLIVTDQQVPAAAPPNVRFWQITRGEFDTLATETIGVPIRLSHVRKLCDFKPTYGHLFQHLIEGYEFWGYTDLDIVYGDLRGFLSKAHLERYDLFTARREYLVGHFSLLRNNEHMRTFYRRCAGFAAILQCRLVLSFDECGHQWEKLWQGQPLSNYAACDSMTHAVRRLVTQGDLKACFSPVVAEWPELSGAGWEYRWEAGQLRNVANHCDAMYLHFHAFRNGKGYQFPASPGGCRSFTISARGIEPAPEGWRDQQASEPRTLGHMAGASS